jgi:hypothetical protein
MHQSGSLSSCLQNPSVIWASGWLWLISEGLSRVLDLSPLCLEINFETEAPIPLWVFPLYHRLY